VIEFFINNIRIEEFNEKRILEVGSKYVNGSVRPLIEKFAHPKEYIGVDVEPGKYVDIVLLAEKLVEHFGEEAFDIVVSTELLEHVKNWRLVITNMKRVLKCGGYIYLTTRSYGFPYHSYPYDYWRYEVEDMHKIFSDFKILVLEKDPLAPGVFLKARKPANYKPNNLQDIALYSMILGKRTISIPEIQDIPFLRRLKLLINKAIEIVKSKIWSVVKVC